MAVVVIQDFESTREEYDQVVEKLDAESNPPEGVIVHTGMDLGGGKMRVVDVWESREAYEKFVQERLGPIIAEVAPDAQQPEIEFHEVIEMVKP
jgi:quinol monooxygenase YgiN